MRRGAETVTIVRPTPPTFPTMGDPTPTLIRIKVPGCLIYPNTVSEVVSRKTGTEVIFGQETVVFGLTCLMPYGTDVHSTDQVEARGALYDVNGEPSKWKSPSTGHKSSVEVQLKGASG